MDYSGWSMIPNVQTHINSPTTSNQDHLFVHQQQQQQQLHHQQQQQQQQQQLQQLQQQHHYQQQQQQQRVHYQQQQQQQQQQHHHPSLASHFHLLLLVENLADAIENGTRDQHPVLVNELNAHFEKCQQLLNSISGSINTKAMTVEGQKRKLEESEHLLNQRRDLIAKYRNSVEELIKYEP